MALRESREAAPEPEQHWNCSYHPADRSEGIRTSQWPSTLPAVGKRRPFTVRTPHRAGFRRLMLQGQTLCAVLCIRTDANANGNRGGRGGPQRTAPSFFLRFQQSSASSASSAVNQWLFLKAGPTTTRRPDTPCQPSSYKERSSLQQPVRVKDGCVMVAPA